MLFAGKSDTNSDKSFFQIISKADDVIKCFVTIMEGISQLSTGIGNLVNVWETNFKSIWETDKNKFISRLSSSNPPLSTYEKNITK